MSQSYDSVARLPRPALRKALIGLAVWLGALAAIGASSGPALAQGVVYTPPVFTPPALFSGSFANDTASVSSVANASLLPGVIEFSNPTYSGQATLDLAINPGSVTAALSGFQYAYYTNPRIG